MVSFADISQKQWIKACRKLGLVVDVSRGKGSHARVYRPGAPLDEPLTIQNHTNKIISQKIYKRLLAMGYTENQINKALK